MKLKDNLNSSSLEFLEKNFQSNMLTLADKHNKNKEDIENLK